MDTLRTMALAVLIGHAAPGPAPAQSPDSLPADTSRTSPADAVPAAARAARPDLRADRLPTDAPLSPGALRVVVDPRIELMGVVQLLAEYPLVTRYDFAYRRAVSARFRPWRDHRAVRLFTEMANRGFSYDAVPKTLAAVSEPPLLLLRVPLERDVVERAGGEKRLEELLQALREFAIESDFSSFYEEHLDLYDSLVRAAAPDAALAVSELRDYLRQDPGGTVLVLAPLLHDGGFAVLQDSHPGRPPRAVAFLGPQGAAGDRPDFGGAERLGGTVWHEFAHTVVNDLTDRHEETVDRHEELFGPIRKHMRRQAYATWQTAVNEHVIRAITSRLVALRYGEDAGREALASEEARGFEYVRDLAERLREFEVDRDSWPTFASFYPRLLEALEEVAAPTRP